MSYPGRVASLFKMIGPGMALRAFAICCRIIFLLVVIPALAPTELTQYFFMVTLALVIGRLVSMGVDEDLPLRIRGNRIRAERYTVLYFLLVALIVLTACSLAFAAWLGVVYQWHIVLLLALVYAAQFVLGGIVRSVRVFGFEVLCNLHWGFFICVSLLLTRPNATGLALAMGMSSLATHMVVLGIVRVPVRVYRKDIALGSLAAELVRKSWSKSVSAFLMLGNLRGLVMWPQLLRPGFDLDDIAFSLMIAEVANQIGMIVVNRRYTAYCADGQPSSAKLSNALKVSALLIVLFLAAGGLTVYAGPAIVQFVGMNLALPWTYMSMAIAANGFMVAFVLVRYSLWSSVDFSWPVFLAEVTCLCGLITMVLTTPLVVWLPALIVLFGVLFGVGALIGAKQVKDIEASTS
ncbi:MAG: hypothetical protein AAAFM81_03245 [Pseudomonadota bacterium]